MDLIFFDLDGTLLNSESQISEFTKDTLFLLKDKGIAFTVATGRTLPSASKLIEDHHFEWPQVFNNGVTIFDPKQDELTLKNLLSVSEIDHIMEFAAHNQITPFVNTIENKKHFIYHHAPIHDIEKELVDKYLSRIDATLLPLSAMSAKAQVTNISMIGITATITPMWTHFNQFEDLIAYSGKAHEGEKFRWMDIHHSHASKGSAITYLQRKLKATNIICFGDSDNDASMFEIAHECYAPENAKADIKAMAHDIIGHNHKDGIAHFLRERFSL